MDIPKTAEIASIEYNRDEGEIIIHDTSMEFDTIVSIAKILERSGWLEQVETIYYLDDYLRRILSEA